MEVAAGVEGAELHGANARSRRVDDARDRVLEGAPPEREVLVDNNKGVSPRLGQVALLAAATGDVEGIL